MQNDFKAQKEKLVLDMKEEFEAQKDKMVDDVVAKVFAWLREIFVDMATEMLGHAVTSSLLGNE